MCSDYVEHTEDFNITKEEIDSIYSDLKKKKELKSRKFIKGPIDAKWVSMAIMQGLPAATISWVIWYLKGFKKRSNFKLTNKEMGRWNISANTKYKGLDQLEKAGLISITKKAGANPIIRILEVK